MLWTHHQEVEGALAHHIIRMYYDIVLLHSNNNSNTQWVRASTVAQACVLR